MNFDNQVLDKREQNETACPHFDSSEEHPRKAELLLEDVQNSSEPTYEAMNENANPFLTKGDQIQHQSIFQEQDVTGTELSPNKVPGGRQAPPIPPRTDLHTPASRPQTLPRTRPIPNRRKGRTTSGSDFMPEKPTSEPVYQRPRALTEPSRKSENQHQIENGKSGSYRPTPKPRKCKPQRATSQEESLKKSEEGSFSFEKRRGNVERCLFKNVETAPKTNDEDRVHENRGPCFTNPFIDPKQSVPALNLDNQVLDKREQNKAAYPLFDRSEEHQRKSELPLDVQNSRETTCVYEAMSPNLNGNLQDPNSKPCLTNTLASKGDQVQHQSIFQEQVPKPIKPPLNRGNQFLDEGEQNKAACPLIDLSEHPRKPELPLDNVQNSSETTCIYEAIWPNFNPQDPNAKPFLTTNTFASKGDQKQHQSIFHEQVSQVPKPIKQTFDEPQRPHQPIPQAQVGNAYGKETDAMIAQLQKKFQDLSRDECYAKLLSYNCDIDLIIKILQVKSIAKVDEESARFHLKHCNWDVQRTLNYIFSKSEDLPH